ncbi:acyl- dehydrogenase family member 11 [Ophiostoma piceae UAMH 11346]|uniref:Acyl-dehydrogenase family member 11 n=1 Tax=Ophiostoma piceae (strain UAMH 11346) TaxID=1262450 RepID=S3BYX4_OPHP1|nr:acyl- dehydrogenase family member 11 [Ophiostoma piceae UAMH 11346]
MAGPVRQPIDVARLEAYLKDNVPEIELPLEIKQFGFGQSNPTYQLTSPSGARYVIRKKPPGKLVSKAAHKVEREYRILAALGGTPERAKQTGVPVPRAYILCEDSSIIGTPFYVMSFLDGRIIEDPAIPDEEIQHDPARRRAMWSAAVRALARLHRVDPASVGLAAYGKPSGFYNRQIQTWKAICAAQAAARDKETDVPVGELPHFQDIMGFFSDPRYQPRDRSTLIHGDFKIDNLVFHKTSPEVIGILDWEMSTRGHPLSDLLNLLTPFQTAHLSAKIHNGHPIFLPGKLVGLPTQDEITAMYAAEAGWIPTVSEVRWAAAFNIFRQAAICQGIAARYAGRQASSEKAQAYATAREPLAEFAWQLCQEARELQDGDGKAKL